MKLSFSFLCVLTLLAASAGTLAQDLLPQLEEAIARKDLPALSRLLTGFGISKGPRANEEAAAASRLVAAKIDAAFTPSQRPVLTSPTFDPWTTTDNEIKTQVANAKTAAAYAEQYRFQSALCSYLVSSIERSHMKEVNFSRDLTKRELEVAINLFVDRAAASLAEPEKLRSVLLEWLAEVRR
jgi:hypothetical protein